jgi:hypothetical protein
LECQEHSIPPFPDAVDENVFASIAISVTEAPEIVTAAAVVRLTLQKTTVRAPSRTETFWGLDLQFR